LTHIKQGSIPTQLKLTESRFSEIKLATSKEEYAPDENVEITAKFSINGGVREAFNEKDWTEAYGANDVSFKLKYGIKLMTGGFRKRPIGRPVDTYRKAAIFWTRNPKLVNPMKDRRIWVQVAKNFEPIIRTSEDDVRHELFDFSERFVFGASELGGHNSGGTYRISAEAYASWQKHEYTELGNIKNNSREITVTVVV